MPGDYKIKPVHRAGIAGDEAGHVVPRVGDGDYNDTVLAYRFTLVLHADGRVKDIRGDFHLLPVGGQPVNTLRHFRLSIRAPPIISLVEGVGEIDMSLAVDGQVVGGDVA